MNFFLLKLLKASDGRFVVTGSGRAGLTRPTRFKQRFKAEVAMSERTKTMSREDRTLYDAMRQSEPRGREAAGLLLQSFPECGGKPRFVISWNDVGLRACQQSTDLDDRPETVEDPLARRARHHRLAQNGAHLRLPENFDQLVTHSRKWFKTFSRPLPDLCTYNRSPGSCGPRTMQPRPCRARGLSMPGATATRFLPPR